MSLPTSPFIGHTRVAVKGCYRTTCQEGDIVRTPYGTIGIITKLKLIYPIGEVVRVYPFTTWLHRIFLTVTGKIWFDGPEINHLKPLHLAPRT